MLLNYFSYYLTYAYKKIYIFDVFIILLFNFLQLKIEELEKKLAYAYEEISSLKAWSSEVNQKESSLLQNIHTLEQEHSSLVDSLKRSNSEKDNLVHHLEQVHAELALLHADNNARKDVIHRLQKEVDDIKTSQNVRYFLVFS